MADLISGLTTRAQFGAAPACFFVDWVAWDSPFRPAGLRPGDRIVAVDGTPVAPPADDRALQRYSQGFIGQLNESAGFSGAPVRLTIRRRAPAKGWQTIEVTATPTPRAVYTNAEGRRALSPDGPDEMESDGFSGSWGSWLEIVVNAMQAILARGWQDRSFVSQAELHMFRDAHESRIAALSEKYPGPFAEAMKADCAATIARAAGAEIPLPPDALEFRRRGEELAAAVRDAATAAWQEAQTRVADSTIPAFPTGHPIRDGMADKAGKHVLLPPLGNSDWIADTGRTWFAASQNDEWIFIDAEAPPAQSVLEAQLRYRRRVTPDIGASWQFLARILPEPRLGMIGEEARFGLQAEPVAALVGDGAMCVDLTAPGAAFGHEGAPGAPFAGEAALATRIPTPPPDDADPVAVLAALVEAVKQDDIDTWRALFADWWVETLDDGRAVVHPHIVTVQDSWFEDARRSILGRVLDARPVWQDDIRVVRDGSAFEGALRIEEVLVELDHVGEFDGVTRSFNDVTTTRWWTLQRVNGGPWRVANGGTI